MILRRLISGSHLRHSAILWAILAAAVCVKIVLHGGHGQVYPVFAASSHHWWADMPLYGPYGIAEGIDCFRYSPTFAVAFTPLAYLPERVGAAVWSVGGILVLLWSIRVLVRDVLPPPGTREERGTGPICAEHPAGRSGKSDQSPLPHWSPLQERIFLTLTLGGSAVGIWSAQSNALLLALIAFGLAAIVRGRWWTASLLLAVPVFIKIWPLAIVLLLVVCWPRQLAVRFVVVCLVLALVPFLTRPPGMVLQQYHDWYTVLTGPLQARNDGYRDAWTFWEQFCRLVHCCRADWADPTSHRVYMAIELAAAVGALAWCVLQARRILECGDSSPLLADSLRLPRNTAAQEESGDESPHAKTGRLLTLILSMWAAWQLLLGPATEQFTYGIIAPSAAWAVLVSFAERRARWLTVSAWALLALAPAGDIESAIARVFPVSPILAPLGVVLFAGWLLWHEWGEAHTVVPSPSGRGLG
jgi:alpha-1,2-mannosyltransferase